MRIIAVWVTAIVLIFATIITWVAISPAYFETVDMVDAEVGDNLTGDAKDAYDTVRQSGNNSIKIIGPAFCLAYVVWALLKMSQRERYTGVYG